MKSLRSNRRMKQSVGNKFGNDQQFRNDHQHKTRLYHDPLFDPRRRRSANVVASVGVSVLRRWTQFSEMSIQRINFTARFPRNSQAPTIQTSGQFCSDQSPRAMQSERCQTDALRSKATRRVYMRLHHKLTDNLKARQEEF